MWYHKLSEILEKHPFKRSVNDEALFMSHKLPESPVWCLVYVDDILMTLSFAQVLKETVQGLKEDRTLSSSESLSLYLGMNLWKTEAKEVCMGAVKYAEKLQCKFQRSAKRNTTFRP